MKLTTSQKPSLLNRLGVTAMVLAASLSATPAMAMSDTPNMLTANVGDLLSGVLSVEYERALSRWFGLTAGVSVWAFRGPFALGDPGFTAFAPEIGVRFHVIRDAPGGLWFGPYASLGYLISGGARPWAWGLGAAAGYNFIFGRHFTLQLGVGGGFTDVGDRLVWAPRLRVGLGAAF
jgi:hypothetical protein